MEHSAYSSTFVLVKCFKVLTFFYAKIVLFVLEMCFVTLDYNFKCSGYTFGSSGGYSVKCQELFFDLFASKIFTSIIRLTTCWSPRRRLSLYV